MRVNTPTDPSGCLIVSDCEWQVPFLGIPVTIRSNSPEVIRLSQRVFASWQNLETTHIPLLPPVTLTVLVHDEDTAQTLPTPFVHRVHDGCYLSAGTGMLSVANRRDGTALAFVTSAAMTEASVFRHHILEGLSLFLVTRQDRIPVHAATLVKDGRAVLLTGASGSGKTTLAYALYRQGAHLLAEDAIYVSRSAGLRLWGHPRGFHLRPEARVFFPELAGQEPIQQPNGKWKISVHLPDEPSQIHARLMFAGEIRLYFLERTPDIQSRLLPLSPQAAAQRLLQERESGFDLNEEIETVVEPLCQHAYILQNGSLVESLSLIWEGW